MSQLDMFAAAPSMPDGFQYIEDLISRADEAALLAAFQDLPFREFEFHGFIGKRRVVSFGWKYDFSARELQRTGDIPDFLLPVRAQAARFAGLDAAQFQHALITEYQAGASIGWHKDKAVFDDVVGISLLSACQFRFRRKAGAGWQRAALAVAPRSAYLLDGPSRHEWEHSIPAVDSLRYSITFRNLKTSGGPHGTDK